MTAHDELECRGVTRSHPIDQAIVREPRGTSGRGSAVAKTGWRDTYGFSLGVNFRPAEKWLWQAGFGYDSSPVSDRNRNAAIPTDRQLRYAGGVQYELNERVNIGSAIEYIDFGDAKIDNTSQLIGKYKDNSGFFFGLNMSYKFGTLASSSFENGG